jgi:hypothetical protein
MNIFEYFCMSHLPTSWQPFPVQIMTHKQQMQIMEYLNYFDSTITSDARRTCEIKYRIATAKAVFN